MAINHTTTTVIGCLVHPSNWTRYSLLCAHQQQKVHNDQSIEEQYMMYQRDTWSNTYHQAISSLIFISLYDDITQSHLDIPWSSKDIISTTRPWRSCHQVLAERWLRYKDLILYLSRLIISKGKGFWRVQKGNQHNTNLSRSFIKINKSIEHTLIVYTRFQGRLSL